MSDNDNRHFDETGREILPEKYCANSSMTLNAATSASGREWTVRLKKII